MNPRDTSRKTSVFASFAPSRRRLAVGGPSIKLSKTAGPSLRPKCCRCCCPAVPRWSTLAPFPCSFSRSLRGCSDQTAANTANQCSQPLRRNSRSGGRNFRHRPKPPMFPGVAAEKLARKRKCPSAAARAQAHQTSVPPRPPTPESNPSKTSRLAKSNAASSQACVRPRPTLRSHIPTSLI